MPTEVLHTKPHVGQIPDNPMDENIVSSNWSTFSESTRNRPTPDRSRQRLSPSFQMRIEGAKEMERERVSPVPPLGRGQCRWAAV